VEGAGQADRTDAEEEEEEEAATAAVSKAQQGVARQRARERVAELELTLCEQRQKMGQADGAKKTHEKDGTMIFDEDDEVECENEADSCEALGESNAITTAIATTIMTR